MPEFAGSASTSAEEYFARTYEENLPGYRSRRIGDRDLLAMAKAALLQALTITDELPRSHWVWQPGYAVQTVNFDASWPVYAGCFAQRIWPSSQRVRLGPFLRESGLLQEAGATIDAIRERRDPYIDVFEVEEFTREYAAECLEFALWEAPA